MAIAIERARRARCCCSVSLMPGSGFGSVLRSLIAVSCSGWEMAQQRREQSSGHAINQQHGEQQEQIQNRKAEHLLTRGMTACFAIAPPASTAAISYNT